MLSEIGAYATKKQICIIIQNTLRYIRTMNQYAIGLFTTTAMNLNFVVSEHLKGPQSIELLEPCFGTDASGNVIEAHDCNVWVLSLSCYYSF